MSTLLTKPDTSSSLGSVTERYFSHQADPVLLPLYEKVMNGQRISRDEAVAAYHSHDLLGIGALADMARIQKMPAGQEHYTYWVRNYHINPTNICEDNCKFCAYKKGPKSPNAYVMDIEQIVHKVQQYPEQHLLKEFHIVSGLYREQSLEFYRDLFKTLRREFPHVQLKGLTAVEMDYIAKLEGITVSEVLDIFMEAGLVAMPGGGAEVFAPRVREAVCPGKITGEEWLHIHGLAHQKGMVSNATMLAGLGETAEERIDHMIAIRQQQDITGGFQSFIPLNCYYENTKIDPKHALTGIENLKNFALARLVMDNMPHIKAFWIHIGEKISQVGLNFGVSDIDGTVVQEKIAHSAGTESEEMLSEQELLHLIRSAGRIPVERDALYNTVQVYEGPQNLFGRPTPNPNKPTKQNPVSEPDWVKSVSPLLA